MQENKDLSLEKKKNIILQFNLIKALNSLKTIACMLNGIRFGEADNKYFTHELDFECIEYAKDLAYSSCEEISESTNDLDVMFTKETK